MKTYKKRIALIVSVNHFLPNGGVGTACQSIVNTFYKNDVLCDIIFDRQPSNDQRYEFSNWFKERGNIIFNDNALIRQPWRNIYRYKEGICFEEVVDFQRSIMKALNSNLYDLFICHSPTAALALYSLDLNYQVPSVVYTHDYNSVFKLQPGDEGRGNFNISATRLNHRIYRLDNFICGTHTERNVRELDCETAKSLPLPLTAPGLLEPNNEEQKGVLFIGRYEPRKMPKKFVKLIAATKLPAKIITNNKGRQKFIEDFVQAGVDLDSVEFALDCFEGAVEKDYLDFKEKTRYIRSCRVAYMPYQFESYGLTVYEALTCMPVVVPKSSSWGENFIEYSQFYWEETDKINERVFELYNSDKVLNNRQEIAKNEQQVEETWLNLLQLPVGRMVENSQADILEKDNFYWHDYINDRDSKKKLNCDELWSTYNTLHKYQRTYTKDYTWLSKKGLTPNDTQDIFNANTWFEQTSTVNKKKNFQHSKIKEKPKLTFDKIFGGQDA